MLGGPLAWLLTLEVGYAISSWTCARDHHGVLHVVTALGVGLALAAGVVSWRSWLALGTRPDDGPGVPRQRFMAGVGLATSALFALVIIAAEVPVLVLRGCG